MFREILLTREYEAALFFLGYDPERFREGFENLEDIFKFVAGSRYFNRDIFLLENRNAQSRIRDRKRPTYTKFLTWCEDRPNLPGYTYPAEKSTWLAHLAEHFPAFREAYEKAIQDLEQQRAVKAKFNGEFVSRLTGLQGKELGALMKRFKESFESPEAQRAFVLEHSTLDIEVRVRRLHLSSPG
jgi:hypothetical protein